MKKNLLTLLFIFSIFGCSTNINNIERENKQTYIFNWSYVNNNKEDKMSTTF